jgi:folate-binding protein YgfZ
MRIYKGFMKAAYLPDRGVIKVAGDDARKFLNGLLTADMDTVSPDRARFAALLTPQGKIVVDCIVAEAPAAQGGGFFIECPRPLAASFVIKLNFYKLRAKVIAEDLSETLGVLAVWDGEGQAGYGLAYPDPRLPALGQRIMLPLHLVEDAAAALGASMVEAADYKAHRIALAIPSGGSDFAYGDAFPHEADMDQLAGVDFDKGCYVGQEVVSRMEHRGNARTRIVGVQYSGSAPPEGTAITAGEKPLGTLGSTAGGHGIALIRVDRLADALAAGKTIAAGGLVLNVTKPDWARFEIATAEMKAVQ